MPLYNLINSIEKAHSTDIPTLITFWDMRRALAPFRGTFKDWPGLILVFPYLLQNGLWPWMKTDMRT